MLKKKLPKDDKVRRPIGRTLIFIISLLILASLGSVTFIVSYFVTKDIKINAMENNLAINSRTASSCETSIKTAVGAADLFLDLAKSHGEIEDEAFLAAEQKFFTHNSDIFAVYANGSSFINQPLRQKREITQNVLDAWAIYITPSLAKAQSGSFLLENASPFFGFPLMAIMYGRTDGAVCILYDTERLGESFSGGSVNQSLFVNDAGDILIHTDSTQMLILTNESENPVFQAMQTSGQSNAQITYRIKYRKGEEQPAVSEADSEGQTDSEGESDGGSGTAFAESRSKPVSQVLPAAPSLPTPLKSPKDVLEAGRILSRQFLFPKVQFVVKKVTDFVLPYQQLAMQKITTYLNNRGEEYIGAYKKLSFGNGGVITVVKTAVILEGIRSTTRRNIYITIAILAIAMLIVYYFSKTLSVPLRTLTEVANEINSGNFNTELFSALNTRGKNEIAVLARSTQNEREILNMVSRLTNQGVTKAVITKKIDFEPHLKDITIFFSDIRGFTAISDGFKNHFGEKSAAEIINFLNDYMTRMVGCITRTGGVVDKFEGDAIMAAWGVLRNETLEWEQLPATSTERARKQAEHAANVKADALSAITSCVAMRYSLMKYNKDAEAFSREHENDEVAKYKPYIRIGSGLNSGRATVGFMGSYDKLEFTSIGDAVNFASRTEASNKPCGTDILITEDTLNLLKRDYVRCKENNFTISAENEQNEIVVEQIPVEFEVKGKGKQHFYGVVNMPHFDITEFFSSFEKDFVLDEDCEKAVGVKGPKTLTEMRLLLNIPEPNFGQVNLDAEENKIQVAAH